MDEKRSIVKYSVPESAITRKAIFSVVNKPAIRALKKAGKDLAERGIAAGSRGSLSARVDGGFIVTATGAKLGDLSDDDFVVVSGFDLERHALLKAEGLKEPSSEAQLHARLYSILPAMNVVVHVHDPQLMGEKAAEKLKLPITAGGHEHGTKDAADAACALLADGGTAAIMKDHGIVAVAHKLEDAVEKLTVLHRRAP